MLILLELQLWSFKLFNIIFFYCVIIVDFNFVLFFQKNCHYFSHRKIAITFLTEKLPLLLSQISWMCVLCTQWSLTVRLLSLICVSQVIPPGLCWHPLTPLCGLTLFAAKVMNIQSYALSVCYAKHEKNDKYYICWDCIPNVYLYISRPRLNHAYLRALTRARHL